VEVLEINLLSQPMFPSVRELCLL